MSKRMTVQFNIKEGMAGEFEAHMANATTMVKTGDKGCEMYDLFKSVNDDSRYVLVESWASEEDIEAHRKSPGMAEMNKIGPFLAGRPTIHRYEDGD